MYIHVCTYISSVQGCLGCTSNSRRDFLIPRLLSSYLPHIVQYVIEKLGRSQQTRVSIYLFANVVTMCMLIY